MRNIFIIGSKGIPANYGGFETFVEKLTEKRVSKDIRYHVACLSDENNEFEYNNSRCFNVKVPNIGSAKAIYYDLIALRQCLKYILENKLDNSIVYILACRIGPFIGYYKHKLRKLGCSVYVNPDGHEWKRSKWNFFIRKYWKISERLMIKHCDLVICDSLNIEKYIKKEYYNYKPKTMYISYGADIRKYTDMQEGLEEKINLWYKEHNIKEKEYYLMVGRFVPENNFEIIINEFMKSDSSKELVIITNYNGTKLYKEIEDRIKFNNDSRIKFVGTVYDQQLLTVIREKAYGYIHGHEVGGTNPSLLEALATTDLNILLNVGFNEEVGKDGAVYFTKEKENLSKLINDADNYDKEKVKDLSIKAKGRIEESFTWEYIVNKYEKLFAE
ncbi:beta 1-4 rhamnosyltransferase Cps2T [Clostridium cibarium]|uniref:DUF1972 domain-containing protein n=1 Tax=Clostridium cibarium TaxID=2762247 RepID=A0ABR8PUD8_9CLOT|nr:DUF1972 domain-containing protein [Clostridium cibarium]MBD7911781.1 DUF1972 domain-containing protein [Clostridium cibarium]